MAKQITITDRCAWEVDEWLKAPSGEYNAMYKAERMGGTQCRNRAKSEHGYCGTHQRMVDRFLKYPDWAPSYTDHRGRAIPNASRDIQAYRRAQAILNG